MTSGTGYQKIDREQIPKDESGNCLVDIFVHLPSSNRFVKFIPAGDPLDQSRLASLNDHVDPSIYVQGDETASHEQPNVDDSSSKPPKLNEPLPEDLKIEIVGKEVQEELTLIFKSFLDPTQAPETILGKIEEQADLVINAIAPETKDLKGQLMKNMKYLNLMNDSSAITALAIMVGLASGYDSKKSYKDLCYACLIMDAGMSEFDEATVRQYYKDRSALEPQVWEAIKKHPVKSHQLALEKMKSLSDVTLQLILNHHELFNGKGYPRGVRYESLFPMVKILSFAVDVFETIKKAELNNQTLSFLDAVLEMSAEKVEPHLRRHSKKLVDTVVNFLGANPQLVNKEDS